MREVSELDEAADNGHIVWSGVRRNYTLRIESHADAEGNYATQAYVALAGQPEREAFGRFAAQSRDDAKARGVLRALLFVQGVDPSQDITIDPWIVHQSRMNEQSSSSR